MGGWIVVHLLQRGEDPKVCIILPITSDGRKRNEIFIFHQCIRVLDIRSPTRLDLTSGRAREVEFIKVDISDANAVEVAFKTVWPPTSSGSGSDAGITIFHTAANIRFYERHPALLHRSARVNVDGTRNIVNSARAIGATVLVQTSSGSVAIRSNRFWLWPWEKEPRCFLQVLNDDDDLIPKRHNEFFSNYAATKIVGESIIRKANGMPSGKGVLKTGCVRPGNGIFGPGKLIFIMSYSTT